MSEAVLTLADLERWSFAGSALAVVGHPIAHSLSPPMHNAALAELARGDERYSNWRYFRFDVEPADLRRALEALHARGFRGVNLTVPHKVLALECAEEVEPEARAAGAVNTLVRTGSGWRGHDTDGYGIATAVLERLGLGIGSMPVLLLGAGGAARAAAVECLRRRCSGLWIANRSRGRLDELLSHLRPLAGEIPVQAWERGDPQGPPAGALVINATSAGLRADDAAPADLADLPRPAGVFDMIYNPPQTRLLRQAQAFGLSCANGLSMLVHQGAKSLEIWTGAPAARTAPTMLAAVERALE
jgi:shikimate dehydrogenase